MNKIRSQARTDKIIGVSIRLGLLALKTLQMRLNEWNGMCLKVKGKTTAKRIDNSIILNNVYRKHVVSSDFHSLTHTHILI